METMEDTDSEAIVEIQTPDIDAEAIMRQIRENLRSRRKEAEAGDFDLNRLAEGEYPRRFDDDLYRDIRQVSASASTMGVSLSVSGKGAVPILSALFRRVRRALHQLVIYYVNRLAAQQNRHNRQVLRVLMGLVRGLERESHSERLRELQDDVEALRNEVARLTALVETGDE
jgi:hypothetical protein